MKKIQNMLKLKPESEKLNLSFLQIETLDDIIYELFHFEKLKSIDLSCNRLRKLPLDMSVLKTVERMDLTNNLFDNIEQALTSLNTMPNLRELNINYDPVSLKHELNHYLPRIETINGQVKKAGGVVEIKSRIVTHVEGAIEIKKPEPFTDAMNDCFMIYEDELMNLRIFHQNVYSIIKEKTGNPKNQTKSFLEKIQSFDDQIKSSYDFNKTVEDLVKNNVITKKIGTYHQKKKFLFQLIKVYNVLVKEKNPKIATCNEHIFQLLELFFTNIESKYQRFDEGFEEKKVEEVQEEVKPPSQDDSNATERTLLKLKLAEMEGEIEDLKKENDEMYRYLINSSKKDVIDFAKKINKNTYGSALETRKVQATAPLTGTKTPNNLLFMKSYTQRQINDLIIDILQCKRDYDEKALRTKTKPETLESYLFIYFQQKYGLKDLIFVEVSSIIDKIKSFANKSVEIEAFRRILKSEVDEIFFWHLQNLKPDFRTKLEDYYKEKVKRSATASEAAAWASARINTGITKEEAEHLLSVSYKGPEFKALKKSFKIYFDENDQKAHGEVVISYSVFFEFVLSHELNKHSTQISSISEFFAKQDEDKNGFISRKQFLNFLDVFALRNIPINAEGLLQQADPTSIGKITFSKMVEVLSSNFPEKDKSKNLISSLNTL